MNPIPRPPQLAWILALPTLLLLGSCVFADPAPEPEVEIEIPRSWGTTSPEGEVQGRWWLSFADPELNSLIEEALVQNRNLRANAEGVRAALAAADIAGADRLPQVGAGLSGQRSKQIFVGLPIPGGSGPVASRSTSYGASLDISWELDLWGKLVARAEAGQADFEASVLEYHAGALSLAAQVAKSWFALRESEAQLALAQRTLETRRDGLEIVRGRYERGIALALDLRLTENLVHTAEAALQLRTRQLDAARRSLELLLGRYPKAAIESKGGIPELPPAPPPGLPAELLDRRPDVRAARTRLLALRYRASEAEAQLYPSLTLTASAGTRSDSLEDLVDGDFSVWSLLGNIVQPIYQGGRLRANLEIAEARVRESAERFANLLLGAFFEVEQTLASEERFLAEIQAYRDAAASARAARELALERYQSGQLDVLTLLDSERNVFTSESFLLQTQRLALQNRVDLHLALGGEISLPDPATGEEATER
jgi:multidrug efflux system outer membrane protein